MSLFSATDLVKHFHSLCATNHVSLDVDHGEVHALIGPNGAGKSTLVTLLSGLLRPDQGKIVLDGQDVSGFSMHKRVKSGLSRCFQITNLFKDATVLDNLMLAVQAHNGSSYMPFGVRNAEKHLNEQAIQLGKRVGIEGSAVLGMTAGSLPHGAQRQLDIALALAARPKVLLDEPMAGMGNDESARVIDLIQELRNDMAIVLIEHDMEAVFKLADRISVLVYGAVIASGTVEEIRHDKRVQDVYLGTEASHE